MSVIAEPGQNQPASTAAVVDEHTNVPIWRRITSLHHSQADLFGKAVKPTVAVISVGCRNPFGLPRRHSVTACLPLLQ